MLSPLTAKLLQTRFIANQNTNGNSLGQAPGPADTAKEKAGRDAIAAYDTNKDGILDQNEIAAMGGIAKFNQRLRQLGHPGLPGGFMGGTVAGALGGGEAQPGLDGLGRSQRLALLSAGSAPASTTAVDIKM